jgi:ATP-dependent Lhr-like helicase
VRTAGAYAGLSRSDFDDCLEFCATGGYALQAYDRWKRLILGPDGLWRLRDPRATRRIRMNIGTIQDTDTLDVQLRGRRGGKPLGEIEESFAATLTPGDTFLIGGKVVRYERLREMVIEVTPRPDRAPKIAAYMGTKFATSTELSHRVLQILERGRWPDLPAHTAGWLHLQAELSRLPEEGRLLIESFPHEGRAHTCFYGFAGRNAQQTLGLLLTHRMEMLGLEPLGFVATDYATQIWSLRPIADPAPLLEGESLREGLEHWLSGNAVMKRTFKTAAVIAGLIDRTLPGQRKSGRQMTISSDVLYDTLLKYDPDHLMLRITRAEALSGLVDFGRIEEMLDRVRGRIDHVSPPHVSPLAAPMLLEMGRVQISGAAEARLMAEEAKRLLDLAGLGAIG